MGIRGIVVAVVAVMGLSACDALKDAKHMKKSTDELNRKSDQLAKRTEDLERELKIKESTAEFTKYMDRVFGENGATTETSGKNPETEMLADAQKAIHSLIFQFWKGDYNEGSEASLDFEMEKSALLFFTRIRKYVNQDNDVNAAGILPIPDRAYKGLASLAARMDSVEPGFEKGLALKGLPANISFYEMVMQALRDRDQIVQSGFLPKAKAAILQWKREAIFTVQLRHNYLPMMALSRFTDFHDRGDVGRGAILLKGLKADLNNSNPELSISNALLVEMTKWLNQALETRQRLRSVKIEPKYNHIFAQILSRVDFGQADILAKRSRTGDAGRDQLIYNFAAAYQKVVDEMVKGSSAELNQRPPIGIPAGGA